MTKTSAAFTFILCGLLIAALSSGIRRSDCTVPKSSEQTHSSADVEKITQAVLRSIQDRNLPSRLTVCAVIKNEGRYLTEWIWYHILHGVDNFIIYDNNSTDNTKKVLQPFIDRNIVTYAFKEDVPSDNQMHNTIQGELIHDCFGKDSSLLPPSEWIAHFDIDEYVYVSGYVPRAELFGKAVPKPLLLQLLDVYKYDCKCGGLLVDRARYGTSGHIDAPSHGFVIQNYYDRENMRSRTSLGKVFVQNEGYVDVSDAHLFTPVDGWRTCLADNMTVRNPPTIDHRVIEPLRINHYQSRSYRKCVDYIDVLIAQGRHDNWRVVTGVAECNISHPGTPEYEPELYTKDYSLRDSLFPRLLERLVGEWS